MEDATKYILRQHIASILDHPSVYMGGPSTGSVKKAIRIIDMLEECCTMTENETMKDDIELIKSWRKSPWNSLERI